MKRLVINLWEPWVALIVLGGLLGGCGPRYLQTELSPDVSLYPVSRIVVLPVVIGSMDRPAGERGAGQVEPGAGVVLTRLLYEVLEQERQFELVPLAEVEAYAPQPSVPMTPDDVQALAVALDAEGILQGVVTVYREREGSHVGVTTPAAIGLNFWMVRGRDNHVIWEGSYYEQQQSMTEELRTVPLYFRRGGVRWLTAEELAEYALVALVRTLPTASSLRGEVSR
jgi:hypothetical protein